MRYFLICIFSVFISSYVFSSTIAAGGNHTVLLTEESLVYTFGLGRDGQLGLGDTENRSTPTLIETLQGKNITAIAAGADHTVLLTDEGEVYIFGRGRDGQLGLGDTRRRNTPTLIETLQGKNITAIAAGDEHTVLLTDEGEVYIFGGGGDGQLGLGDTRGRSTPTLIESLQGENIIAIAAGADHTALLTDKGEVYIFGSGGFGQLGLGDTDSRSTPTLIESLQGKNITAIAAGGDHTVLLTDEGEVYTFGDGHSGQLGLGDTRGRNTPTLIETLQGENITTIAAGGDHTVLLSQEAQVYIFGRGLGGELGLGDGENRNTPTLIESLQGENITAIAAGTKHTVLLTDEGEVYIFGLGRFGQLGLGDTESRVTPEIIANIQKIKQPSHKKRLKSASSIVE